jgi:two-component system, chemotaxis family, chemotaxis protein CheY
MGHSFLIVDDSATTRAYIKRTLQLAGFPIDKCHEAADGAAGLEVLRSNAVDLVLADLHMPVMDGAEMARRILNDEVLKHVPVLVVSADPNTQRLDQLRDEGVAGYVRKPFTPEAFRDAVRPILGGAHDPSH